MILNERGKESDDLNGLAQSHLIGQYSVLTDEPLVIEPVETFHLVAHHFSTSHRGRLRSLHQRLLEVLGPNCGKMFQQTTPSRDRNVSFENPFLISGLEIEPSLSIFRSRWRFPYSIFIPEAFVLDISSIDFPNTSKVDFLFSTVTVTEQRKAAVDFSAPYMKSGWQILVRRGDATINDFAANGESAR